MAKLSTAVRDANEPGPAAQLVPAEHFPQPVVYENIYLFPDAKVVLGRASFTGSIRAGRTVCFIRERSPLVRRSFSALVELSDERLFA